jgi:hypothetical protein
MFDSVAFANTLSTLALLIALASLLVSWRQTKIEVRRDQVQSVASRKAAIRPRFENSGEPHRPQYRLWIENVGPGAATSIRVVVDGAPLSKAARISRGRDVIERLEPGADVKFLRSAEIPMPTEHEFAITWDDESGEPGQYHSRLSL